jgi:hypothetical protein
LFTLTTLVVVGQFVFSVALYWASQSETPAQASSALFLSLLGRFIFGLGGESLGE